MAKQKGKNQNLKITSNSPERRLCAANQQRLDKDDQRVDVYRGPEAAKEGDGAAPVGGDHQLQLANSPTAHQWDSRWAASPHIGQDLVWWMRIFHGVLLRFN